jgi:hypothetical protein
MARLPVRVVLALVVLAAAAAAGLAATARSTSSSSADQIRQLERTLLRDTVAGDRAAVGTMLAPDFQLIDPFGSPESRSTYLGNLDGGVDFMTFKPISTIQVRLFGAAAVARFQASFVVKAGPDLLKHRGWVTDLFEQRGGRWLQVWSQITATPNNADLFVRALKAHP